MEDWTKEEAFEEIDRRNKLSSRADKKEAKSRRAVEHGEPREGEHDD